MSRGLRCDRCGAFRHDGNASPCWFEVQPPGGDVLHFCSRDCVGACYAPALEVAADEATLREALWQAVGWSGDPPFRWAVASEPWLLLARALDELVERRRHDDTGPLPPERKERG